VANALLRLGQRLFAHARQREAGIISGQVNWPETWWQAGLSPLPRAATSLAFPAVYASIDTISSDIAALPLRHYRIVSAHPRRIEEVANSAPIRVLNYPNDYQTTFDLLKGLITSQLFRGNGYLYGVVNGRSEFDELHLLVPDLVVIRRNSGEVYYQVTSQPLASLDAAMTVLPARVIFNHRMFCLGDPLYGITPLLAAALSSAAGLSILRSTEAFFRRMARPSGVLQTASRIDPTRAEAIKERWNRVFRGEEQAGDTAVLEEGLEWKPLTMTAVDAQLIEQLRYSVEDVARVYRLPLFMLGDLTTVNFSSSEQLTRIYYSGCLAAHIAALQTRLTSYFRMDPREEYLEFDLNGLFRTEMRARIESLTRAIQGGLRTPNEAREIEGLNPAEGGDTIFLQQQMVPATVLAARTDLSGAAPPPGAGARLGPPVGNDRAVANSLLADLGFDRIDDDDEAA
jgi:HK97 family phage portal protein